MNIESFREECLALPYVTEDLPFDDTVIVFRLKGKIFGFTPSAISTLPSARWRLLRLCWRKEKSLQ